MNEGKPAQGPAGQPESAPGAPGRPDTGEPVTPGAETPAGPSRAGGPAGDAEAVRADGSRAGAGAPAEGRAEAEPEADGDGDYELERPAVGDAAVPHQAVAAPESPSASGAVAAGLAAPAAAGPAAPAAASLAGPDASAAAVPAAPAGLDVTSVAPVSPAAERPKPLHDPDPYSTPPYGEPGPWAPAPPVQHPATTPAHGTAVVAPPGAPVPPVQHTVPAPGAGAALPPGRVAPPGPVAPVGPHPASLRPPAASLTPPHDAVPLPVAAPVAEAPAPAPALHDAPAPAESADPWGRYDPWAVPAAGALQQNGAAVPRREQRRRRGRQVLVGGILLVALVSGGVGGIVGAYLERNGGVGGVELPQAGKESSGRSPGSVAGIAARALPAVVTLHVSGDDEQGTGTGFVLDDRGHILTNNHVVEPAGSDGEITVTFNSGETARAEVVGRDSGYDLAVVRVTGVKGLTPMPLGNSDNVRVGDPVVAIGAPFDLAGTVTSGIISARQRPITAGGGKGDGSDVSYVDALQTDAPINPGNSGGPLLDAEGRVVGINSAIRSADSGADTEGGQSGSIGLGFAIPINQGKRVAEELINTGRATHPVIGISLDMDYSGDGARVGSRGSGGGPAVSPGGPGAKAGIRAGDVITEVDGQRVHSGEELIVKTRSHRPGDRLELTLERDGDERTLSLVLGSSRGE